MPAIKRNIAPCFAQKIVQKIVFFNKTSNKCYSHQPLIGTQKLSAGVICCFSFFSGCELVCATTRCDLRVEVLDERLNTGALLLFENGGAINSEIMHRRGAGAKSHPWFEENF